MTCSIEQASKDVPRIDRHTDEAHAEIAGRRANLDLERDRIAAVHKPAQHLERI